MSKIIQIDPSNPNPEIIRRACMLLGAGELVGVPTETVYGIACDPAHLEKLYAAKERERGKPIARLAASLKQVEALGADFGRDGRALAEKYWPGPLTLVLNTPGGPTGFRVPDHAVPLALARAFDRPIALTSANKSGGTDATSAQEAFQTLEPVRKIEALRTSSRFRASTSAKASADRSPSSAGDCFQPLKNTVSLYLDCLQPLDPIPSSFRALPRPSTVLMCTQTETKILREGAVPTEELKRMMI